MDGQKVGEKDVGERLVTIEALMQERKETGGIWRTEVDKKLDKIINNGKNLATINVLKDAIVAHAESCPARINPSNPNAPKILSWAKIGWKELGVLGCTFGIIFVQSVIILRLLEVI